MNMKHWCYFGIDCKSLNKQMMDRFIISIPQHEVKSIYVSDTEHFIETLKVVDSIMKHLRLYMKKYVDPAMESLRVSKEKDVDSTTDSLCALVVKKDVDSAKDSLCAITKKGLKSYLELSLAYKKKVYYMEKIRCWHMKMVLDSITEYRNAFMDDNIGYRNGTIHPFIDIKRACYHVTNKPLYSFVNTKKRGLQKQLNRDIGVTAQNFLCVYNQVTYPCSGVA